MTHRETLEQFHAQLMTMVTAIDAIERAPGCDPRAVERLGETCNDITLAATGIKSILRLTLPDEADAAR